MVDKYFPQYVKWPEKLQEPHGRLSDNGSNTTSGFANVLSAFFLAIREMSVYSRPSRKPFDFLCSGSLGMNIPITFCRNLRIYDR